MFRQYRYTTAGGKNTKGIFINNYMPRVQPHTASQVAVWNKFGLLNNIVTDNPESFKEIWQLLIGQRHRRNLSWHNEFISVNMNLVGTPSDFTKMLLSDGMLEPAPSITSFVIPIHPGIVTINFDSATYQNGRPSDIVYGAILDELSGSFTVLPPTQVWLRTNCKFEGTFTTPLVPHQWIVFVWFYRSNIYSKSVSLHE